MNLLWVSGGVCPGVVHGAPWVRADWVGVVMESDLYDPVLGRGSW